MEVDFGGGVGGGLGAGGGFGVGGGFGTGGGGGSAGGAAGGSAGGAAGGSAGGAAGGSGGGAAGGSGGGSASFSGTYVTTLSGAEQNPPVTTAASGTGTFTLSDPDGGAYSLSWSVTHDAGLTTAAHLHHAWATQNGPVAQDLGAAASPITGSAAVSNTLAERIASGHAYVNIHTTAHPDGEIRGQVLKPGQQLWSALLSGSEQVPPVVGADAGALGVVVDPPTVSATYRGFWPNTPATDAGVFQGGALATGPLIQILSLTDGGAAGSFPLAGLGMGDGGFYVSVQTSANPAGEIRGQLTQKQ